MFNFFYQFFKRPLAWNLYSQDSEDGTPSPPLSEVRITEDGITRITEDGQIRITE